MRIIPAIDIREGKCVRLVQGDPQRETVFFESPIIAAAMWERFGAQMVHVVDLDGAFRGYPVNLGLVERIASSVKIPVQLGGGLRTRRHVEEAFQAGARRVVVGTSAVRDPRFVGQLIADYGPRVLVGIDARDGMVAVEGWSARTAIRATELARLAAAAGASEVVYTDISRDGTLAGPNMKGIETMLSAGVRLIASGGIGSLEDVKALAGYAAMGLSGVIIGRALYDGRIDLKEALRLVGRGDNGAGQEDNSLP